MGTKEKRGKEVICTQSNVLAQQPGMPRLPRTPAQGAPPITLNPHLGCSTRPSWGPAFTPTPRGPHSTSETAIHPIVRGGWKTRLLLGKWASVFLPLLRLILPTRSMIRTGNPSLCAELGVLSSPRPSQGDTLASGPKRENKPYGNKEASPRSLLGWLELPPPPEPHSCRARGVHSEHTTRRAGAGYELVLLPEPLIATLHLNTSFIHPSI